LGEKYFDLDVKEKAVEFMKEASEIFEVIESPDAEDARTKLREWGAL
jgi:hypothetical protein